MVSDLADNITSILLLYYFRYCLRYPYIINDILIDECPQSQKGFIEKHNNEWYRAKISAYFAVIRDYVVCPHLIKKTKIKIENHMKKRVYRGNIE